MPKTKLIVVRHSSTPLNSTDSSDCIRGWLDVPISAKGIEEVLATAQDQPIWTSLRSERLPSGRTSSRSSARTSPMASSGCRSRLPNWRVAHERGKAQADDTTAKRAARRKTRPSDGTT